MHATSLAMELNIPKVIIPINSSVFSAWGMLMSDLRRDFILTQLNKMNLESLSSINNTFSTMENKAISNFKKEKRKYAQ